jgi:hypothetical protein
VASIHTKNGTVTDNAITAVNGKKSNFELFMAQDATNMVMKFSFGISYNYFKRNATDNLVTFWRLINQDNKLELSSNPRYISGRVTMCSVLGGTKRNWFGTTLELIFTPPDAINASNINNGLNEIKLHTFLFNISMFYGHTINHKKNLILIFEPSLDGGGMSGTIRINDEAYKVSSSSGMGYHLAIGTDWIISKRLVANLRLGERFVKIKESHYNTGSSTGFSYFPVNNEHILVNWNGAFASLGLAWSLYGKMPSHGR